MKIRRHFLTLRRSFANIAEQAPIEITTQELAALLDCTQRNMVLLLQRMEQEGWLTWTPKRGRGNRSTLVFTKSAEELALEEAKELVLKQDISSALALLQQLDAAAVLREQFLGWLSGQFGFHSEVEGRRRTDVLRFPLPQNIHSLDPAAIHYIGESHLVNQLFDGLVRMDHKGEEIMPLLAHAWEADHERTLWTFYLRKGVLFHHGKEMSSSDVKYSLNRLKALAPHGLYSWVYNDIVAMDTPDDTTIRIRLRTRNELFLPFLTTNRASIVPQDVCEAAGAQFAVHPIGTGPFRFAGNEHGIWKLEAFTAYFQGRAFLDRVEVWTIGDGKDDDNRHALERFQVMHNVRISDSGGDTWQQVRQSGTTCKFITINELKSGPLQTASARGAVNAAIHRAELLTLLSGDVIEPANSFLRTSDETGQSASAADCPISKQAHPSAQAESRKDQADASAVTEYEGEPLILATIPQYEADAEFIRKLCAKAGINITIRLIKAEQFQGTARMSADLLLFAVMLDEHRELRLIDLYKSVQQHMPAELKHWLEFKLDELSRLPTFRQREPLFLSIERELMQTHRLLILYRKHLKTAFHPSVRGISLEALGWVRFKDIWFT